MKKGNQEEDGLAEEYAEREKNHPCGIDAERAADLMREIQANDGDSKKAVDAIGELFMPRLKFEANLRFSRNKYLNLGINLDDYLEVAMEKFTHIINDPRTRSDRVVGLVMTSICNRFKDLEREAQRRKKLGYGTSVEALIEEQPEMADKLLQAEPDNHSERQEMVEHFTVLAQSHLTSTRRGSTGLATFNAMLKQDPETTDNAAAEIAGVPRGTHRGRIGHMRRQLPNNFKEEVLKSFHDISNGRY